MKNTASFGAALVAAAIFGFAIAPHAGVADAAAHYTTVSATVMGSDVITRATLRTLKRDAKGSYLVGHVKFKPGLFDGTAPVQVITSMRSLDTGDRTQCGFYAQSVTKLGFDLYFDKGSTGGCYGAAYTWAASQTKQVRI